jgi:hypothetical protein
MLAIDENQLENFDESIWQRSFVLFFLGLMNLGIPVLLLGNPMAFSGLEAASQTMRRMSAAGYHTLAPAKKSSDAWWAKQYVPGICRFSLCEEIPAIHEVVDATFEVSAGVPGLFGAIWCEAQRIALRRGPESAALTHADIKAAFDSPRVVKIRDIALQVLGNSKVRRFLDIPVEADPAQGGAARTSCNDDQSAGSDHSKHEIKTVNPIQAVRSKLEKQALAKERAAAKRREKAEHPDPEDLRIFEAQMEIFAGLEGVQEPLLAGAKRAGPKAR